LRARWKYPAENRPCLSSTSFSHSRPVPAPGCPKKDFSSRHTSLSCTLTFRTQYQAIFTPETPQDTTPVAELLLTRTFALAISPIPDQAKEARSPNLPSIVDARKPYLMQGLLAAEILASLAPGHESGVTRAWLASGNGFAQNLFMLIRQLSAQFEQQGMHAPPAAIRGGNVRNLHHASKRDLELVYIVGLAVGMLRRLSERARDPNAPPRVWTESSIPPNVLPSRDSVLGALTMSAPEWTREGMLADLVAYAGLED
jgi:SWI/SNF chromatin-remodeling complex subunit SWI1